MVVILDKKLKKAIEKESKNRHMNYCQVSHCLNYKWIDWDGVSMIENYYCEEHEKGVDKKS